MIKAFFTMKVLRSRYEDEVGVGLGYIPYEPSLKYGVGWIR
jgi:hypothetical protein